MSPKTCKLHAHTVSSRYTVHTESNDKPETYNALASTIASLACTFHPGKHVKVGSRVERLNWKRAYRT
eukprot:1400129-Amphidinium_carterae.2